MKDGFWFQSSLHRLLVDMHIPDWDEQFLRDFSPENYADMMQLARVGTAEIYAGSCLGLCYWPTKIGFQHRQLHGRDLLGETVEACRRRGINVQIYLNVWSRAAYDAHPDWRIRLSDGGGTVDHHSRFGQCCPNTGYGDFFLRLLGELVSLYDCCGYWIDMIGNYWYCQCDACQKRFRRETGFPRIPVVVDWNDPVWLAYDRCRSRWLDEFAQGIASVVRAQHPERTVTLQSASLMRGRASGIGPGFLSSSAYLAGDFTGGSIQQSCVCKYFSLLSQHHPMEFMTPRCENLAHHTTERSYENLLMRSYAAIANQASFTLIDAIDPRGTLDRRFYEHAGRINASYERFEPYISGESQPWGDVGIYCSQDSLIDVIHEPQHIDRSAPQLMFNGMRENLVGTLQRHHLLFRFVRGTDCRQLAETPLLILSNCSSLSDEECAAMERYVANGGTLVATGFTSLYDPDRGRRPDFKLARLFGVHYDGDQTGPINYISPIVEDSLPGVTRDYPLTLESPQPLIVAEAEAEVLGTLTLPLSSSGELYRFASAISNPPMIFTDRPALVSHGYGKGRVLYSAGLIEQVNLDFHQRVFASLLKGLLAGRSLLETNAPRCVECTLFKQESQHRLVFSCLNLPAELPALPLHDLEFRLRLPADLRPRRVLRAPENQDVPLDYERGTLTIRLDRLEEFALFVVEY